MAADVRKLHVSETDKYIYIMESGQKRLAVFEKNGDFRLQYTGQNLDKLKDFAVDEEKKLIYFLAGNKILKLNILNQVKLKQLFL